MKQFQHELLAKMKAIRPAFISIKETSQQKEFLQSALQQFNDEFKGDTLAVNFKNHINGFLMSADNNIDAIIKYLESKIENPFDAEMVRRETEDKFDALYGTKTDLILEQIELPEVVSAERIRTASRFIPSPVKSVEFALQILEQYKVVYKEWSFIDIGSGLGRNLLLASQHPFQKVIGVEISSFLCEQALKNITQYNLSAKQPCHAEVYNISALDFIFPESNLVLYFWEPFNEDIQATFIDGLETFIKTKRHKVILMFLGNIFPGVKASSSFKLLGIHPTPVILREDHYFMLSIYTGI